MAAVNVTNINVLDNPAPFTHGFSFEITFECVSPLADGTCTGAVCGCSMKQIATRPPPLFWVSNGASENKNDLECIRSSLRRHRDGGGIDIERIIAWSDDGRVDKWRLRAPSGTRCRYGVVACERSANRVAKRAACIAKRIMLHMTMSYHDASAQTAARNVRPSHLLGSLARFLYRRIGHRSATDCSPCPMQTWNGKLFMWAPPPAKRTTRSWTTCL